MFNSKAVKISGGKLTAGKIYLTSLYCTRFSVIFPVFQQYNSPRGSNVTWAEAPRAPATTPYCLRRSNPLLRHKLLVSHRSLLIPTTSRHGAYRRCGYPTCHSLDRLGHARSSGNKVWYLLTCIYLFVMFYICKNGRSFVCLFIYLV